MKGDCWSKAKAFTEGTMKSIIYIYRSMPFLVFSQLLKFVYVQTTTNTRNVQFALSINIISTFHLIQRLFQNFLFLVLLFSYINLGRCNF